MTTNERRAAWRQYYLAALVDHDCDDPDTYADSMLAAEDERFGRDDDHAAIAAARAHALEQQTRAENAEMALREVRAQLAASVPVGALRRAVTSMLDSVAYCGRLSHEASGAVLDAAAPVSALITAAEQRAAAKPADGGEP